MNKVLFLILSLLITLTSCNAGSSNQANDYNDSTNINTIMTTISETDTTAVMVDIKTSLGDIRIMLYNETPKHRDNFIKLVNDGFYDGTLFHRVISNFMIQAGDPDSKNAPAGKMLGSGGPGYQIDAEIIYPKYFHKRGAIAAARQGDQVNPERKSSGSQFYIVTGNVYNDSTLKQMEGQLAMQQKQAIFNELAVQHRDEIMTMRRNRDNAALQALQEKLIQETEAKAALNPAKFTQEQIDAYTSIGGSPHLDNQYTVFGEVISGMDVVAKIEQAKTNSSDRPTEDIKIISTQIIK